jgi:hypothetical protein
VELATPAAKTSQRSAQDQPGRRSWLPYVIMAAYLLGAIYVTSRLWLHPGSAQSGDPNDVNQMSWFMRYGAEAIAHFRLPALVTSAMNAPHTVNLMWNTSLLLPSVIMAPVTLLAGPQVSLNLLLVLGFAGSAASLYFVLRRWGASIGAAAVGGALYGFSPAMIQSGIGHYHLVLAMCPPLMIDALLRFVTGRGSAVKNGLWLGVLAAIQLFIGEEALIDTVIAAAILLIILAACYRTAVLGRLRQSLIGLATAAGAALVLCARALWVQFHGVSLGSGAYHVVLHHHHLTQLYTIPYAWVVPSGKVILQTSGSHAIFAGYPQPAPEYLAYLGIPLIIVLLAAGIYYWRLLRVRVPFCTLLVLELLSLGGQPIGFYPGKLLPWYWLADLPLLKSTLPDRLTILADAAAAAVLAFALDETLRRWRARHPGPATAIWRDPAIACAGVVALALLPLFPVSYSPVPVAGVPAGYAEAFSSLRVPADARVLVVPVATGGVTLPMRWYAEQGVPGQLIGGDFIDASAKGRASRSGRAGPGCTPLGQYLDSLWLGGQSTGCTLTATTPTAPTRAEIQQQIAAWRPAAIVADTQPDSALGQFLVAQFGAPTFQQGDVLAWKLSGSGS